MIFRRFLLALATSFVLLACRRALPVPREGSPIPRRVISLAPNLTEIVFAVGAGQTLVGVSEYSDFPPEALAIPRVGGLEVSPERVASLSPDLVLATPEGNTKGPVTALASAGIPVLVVPGESLDAVVEGIRLVGRRLHRAQAAESLAASLERRRQAVRVIRVGRRSPGGVVLVWPDPPQAAGGKTFLSDLLREAGAQNLLESRPGWPLVSREWLATAPIDVLVVPDSPETRSVYDRAFSSGALSRGTVARARIVRIDESILTRPGPRVFDALEQLAGSLAGPPGTSAWP